MLKKILYIVLTLLLGSWVGFWANKTIKQINPTVQTTPTPIGAQPTPSNREQSVIASQSAFLNTRDAIASLSASISRLTTNDTILNPPAIELPLGFADSR